MLEHHEKPADARSASPHPSNLEIAALEESERLDAIRGRLPAVEQLQLAGLPTEIGSQRAAQTLELAAGLIGDFRLAHWQSMSPLNPAALSQIRSLYAAQTADMSDCDIARALVVLEPEGGYQRGLGGEAALRRAERGIVRIAGMLEDNGEELWRASEADYFDLICKRGYGTADRGCLQDSVSVEERRHLFLSAIALVEIREVLKQHRAELEQNPAAIAQEAALGSSGAILSKPEAVSCKVFPFGAMLTVAPQDLEALGAAANATGLFPLPLPQGAALQELVCVIADSGDYEERRATIRHEASHLAFRYFFRAENSYPPRHLVRSLREFYAQEPDLQQERDFHEQCAQKIIGALKDTFRNELIAYGGSGALSHPRRSLQPISFLLYQRCVNDLLADRYPMGSEAFKELAAVYDRAHEELSRWEIKMRMATGLILPRPGTPFTRAGRSVAEDAAVLMNQLCSMVVPPDSKILAAICLTPPDKLERRFQQRLGLSAEAFEQELSRRSEALQYLYESAVKEYEQTHAPAPGPLRRYLTETVQALWTFALRLMDAEDLGYDPGAKIMKAYDDLKNKTFEHRLLTLTALIANAPPATMAARMPKVLTLATQIGAHFSACKMLENLLIRGELRELPDKDLQDIETKLQALGARYEDVQSWCESLQHGIQAVRRAEPYGAAMLSER